MPESSKRQPLETPADLAVPTARGGGTRRMVVALLVAGTIISVAVAAWLWNGEQQRVARVLERGGETLVDSTAYAISDAVTRLNAVSGLYESSDEVTQDEFLRFVDNLGLLPGLKGIGYMPLVSAGDLDRFEAKMRETVADYQVFELGPRGARIPVGQRPVYLPVQWFDPLDAFEKVHGFDSLSNADRRAALGIAGSTGEVAATPFLQLVSKSESDGFLLYWPVSDPDTGEVTGFTVAPMDLSELIDSRLPTALEGQVGWSVADVTGAAEDLQPGLRDDGSWVGSLDVGGRRWRITVIPMSSSDMIPHPTVPLLALLLGVLVSGLAAAGVSLYGQRSQARQELELLKDRARARDQFLASVSHELRTPLTGVLGFAELLEDDDRDLSNEECRSMIASIVSEATDMAHIIDDLLVEARSELELLAVARVPVAVRAEVTHVLEAAGDEIVAGVEILGDPEGSYRADADPARVRQILRNLISNASRYGGDQVQIRLAATSEAVLIQVVDNGPGVPRDAWERIFECYYRVHDNGTQPAAVGIGLSVARQLARLMDGDLSYRREGNWSVLELRLPSATRAPTNVGAPTPPESPMPGDSRRQALQDAEQ